jgi:type VII secretion-associated serine protease mycosin
MGRGGGRRLVAAACAVVLAGVTTAVGVLGSGAPAYAACTSYDSTPTVDATSVPWPIQRYAPDRLANLADGRGVTVAVIDSGVDARHPALKNHVVGGLDLLDPGGDGRYDCIGHGTAVASIIAGQSQAGIGFRGLAPGATIIPYRVTEQTDTTGPVTRPNSGASGLVTAINAAVKAKATVINISMVLKDNDPAVAKAIKDALDSDVVVVAAAGNAYTEGNPKPYPASYDGVIGVGAIGPDGQRYSGSQVGDYVDLVAPGAQVVAAHLDRGYSLWEGTSFAAPYVAATAALVRQYWKNLSAPDVAARLLATADPSPGNHYSWEYGHGVVNPYRAVTEQVTTGAPARLAPLPPRTHDPSAEAAETEAARTRTWALGVGAAGGGLAALVLLAATILPRGRRRGWQPGG